MTFKLILVICFFAVSLYAESISGRVVGIADGDTITILVNSEQRRIRLWGIDAPEKKQPFGQAAKKHLSGLVFGKDVKVEVKDTDRYGRTVGIVFDEKVEVNLEMIKTGYAWCYRQYCKDKQYIDAEAAARTAKSGLWSEPDPVPPWDWRKNKP